MPEINIWGHITGKDKKERSKEIAKKRLKDVLMQDRTHVPAFILNKIQEDVKKIFDQYFELDSDNINVSFKKGNNNSLAMNTNVPILRIRSEFKEKNN